MVYFMSKVIGIRCKAPKIDFLPRVGEKITLNLLYSYGKEQWIVSDIKYDIVERKCEDTGVISIEQDVCIYLDLA